MPLHSLLLALLLIATSAAATADDSELKQLADEDQAVRMGAEDPRSDSERRVRILELIAAGRVISPRDKVHAAIVLQHTGLTVCNDKLVSTSPENYLLAHNLAKEAFEAKVDDPRARYLVAQTIDRYLTFTQGYQRYGTNRLIDMETGKEYLPYIDRAISDDERAKYGVPALKDLLAQFPEKEKPAPKPSRNN